jgi:signal transduction histidine kinase
VLVVGQSLTSEQHARPALLLILTIGGVGGLVLALAGAWFLAGRALVPIQQAFRRQQEFVADASHELRTPLTVLRLATDLLHQHRREPLAANGELFDDVRSEIGRLQRLTADLLTLARSDRGELELAVAAVDLAHLTTDVVRRVGALAQARGVELAYAGPGQDGVTPATTPEQSDAIVDADPDRLQQVLLILLDNAVQYTPSGGRIAVAVGAHDGYATVEVVDDGPGIAPEHLARVFERFYRADAARTRGEGGTGLGLAIAKSLVEAHRGELSLTSQPGAGTRALVTLPRAAGRQSLAARIGTLARRYAR